MKNNYDLIIIGGGVAGVSAAIAASRKNLSVAIIEKNSILGGLATSGLINWFEPLCDGKGNQILFSLVEELFSLAIKYGYKSVDDNWKDNLKRKASWFDHNLFALSLNRLLSELKVDVYYETTFISANVEDERIIDISLLGTEIFKLRAKEYIDASGNAILARSVNIPCRRHLNYLTYVTTTYKNGLNKPLMQYVGATCTGLNHPDGLKLFDALNQDDVNEYNKLAMNLCLKEYEKGNIKEINTLPSMIQFRKSASIIGEYTLTKNDKNKHQIDSIGVIPMFNTIGDLYELPLRCLYNKKIKNLMVAGRIISSDDEALEVVRVIPVAIMSGEVCGIASYLKIIDKFSYNNLKEILSNKGYKINF